MLYRLDYNDGEREGVKDRTGSQFLSRHMATARRYATEVAAETDRAIQVTRVDLSGRLRPTLVIHPDGRASQPEGMKVGGVGGDCKATPDGPPCFCSNCRAARRNA